MTDLSSKELSLATYNAMDFLGYSKDMIKSRSELVENMYLALNSIYEQLFPFLEVASIFTGSKGEGIAKLSESDIDILVVLRNFLCLDSAQKEKGISIIKTILTASPPGYTKLNPLEMDSNLAALGLLGFIAEYDLCRGQIFLSSTCLRNYFDVCSKVLNQYLVHNGMKREFQKHTGPSVPCAMYLQIPLMPYLNKMIEADIVLALPYLSSTVFESWRRRDRIWPYKLVCQEILETEAYVVPVGPSYSDNQDFEWRISFTNAEKILVSSLSPVLLKVYILFKMVKRDIIEQQGCILSSYMIKNVIFWISERMDSSISDNPDKLLDILQQAFAFLFNCLQCRFLPNYMMQDINLLAGKGKPCDISRLQCTMATLLDKGGRAVMEIEKVKTSVLYVEKKFTDAKRFAEKRDKFEKVYLQMFARVSTNLSPESLLQPSLISDVIFDMIKDPCWLECMCLLLKFLNLDFVFVMCNPGLFVNVISNIFFE